MIQVCQHTLIGVMDALGAVAEAVEELGKNAEVRLNQGGGGFEDVGTGGGNGRSERRLWTGQVSQD